MLVDLNDGACRECGEQLEITDADDCTMDVQCTNPECGEAYTVEPDAFGDGCLLYYVPFMVELEFGPEGGGTLMDPQQIWTDMLEALERKQWEPAKELADSLYEWLKNGGFPPTTIGAKSIGKKWHAAVAQFICLAIASKVNDIEKRRSRRGSIVKRVD